jgi:hypothetical protein
MSSKKRKGDELGNATAEASQTSSPNLNQSKPDNNKVDGGDEYELATIRTLLMGRDAELAAALLEIERLRAAVAEPCPRCHFYSDWTVRVRTMNGQVHTIACPDGPQTLVAHVKQKLAQFDPKCHILQQVTLVLPCEASNSSADPTEPALADDRTLASYGVSKRDALDLFLVDMNWSDECVELIDRIKNGGEEIEFYTELNKDLALAVSWALVNAVRLLLLSRFTIRNL